MKSLGWPRAISPIFCLVIGLFLASYAWASEVHVDPALNNQLQAEGSATMLVYLRERADLSRAFEMSWEARGHFVQGRLQAVAGRSQADLRRYLDARGAQYKAFWIDNVIVVENGDMTLLNELASRDDIASILGEQEIFLIEPEFVEEDWPEAAGRAVESNIEHIGAPDVWADGVTGTGIVVASIDTGVRYTHEALVNSYRGNQGGGSFEHNHNWWSPYNSSTAPEDSHNHGSHVTGTMTGDDGGGNQIGVAPGAEWIACQGFSPGSTTVGLLECGEFLTAPWDLNGENADPDLRPHVINNSWGNCDQFYNAWYQGVVDAWIAAGIAPIVSNGNSSNCGYSSPPGLNTVGNPARYASVMGIGSTGTSNGQYANHSNWGPTDNPNDGSNTALPDPMGFGNIKPNVSAPGVSIRSAGRNSDTHYYLSTGTSMAGPHAAALVALMWEAAPCLVGDYATTGTIMMQTANAIPYATNNGDEGPGNVPNHATGWGEINAVDAVSEAQAQCAAQGVLDGTVTRADNSVPLEGAQVVAVGPVTRSTTTGPGGSYSLEVTEGTYEVTASLPGFIPTTVIDVVVDESSSVTVDLALDPAPIANISQDSISIMLTLDGTGSRSLTIGNDGEGELNWSIAFDEMLASSSPMGFVGDFHVDNWTFENSPSGVNGSFNTNPGPPVELFIIGGNAGVAGDADFWIEVPATGTISFDWGYQSIDEGTWDSGGYVVNGSYTQLADNDAQVPFFNQSASVEVSAGDVFAFRVNTADGQFGPGELGVTNFDFTPAACNTFTSVPWLNADPESGATPGESAVDIDVLFDATGLGEGLYSAAICITTDDVNSPLVAVPVELEVVSSLPPVIDVDPASVAATVLVDSVETRNIGIANQGEDDLTWSIDTAEAPASQYEALSLAFGVAEGCDAPETISWLSVDPASGMTAGGDATSVDVHLDANGLAVGTYEAMLCINSNDASNPLVDVPVTMTVTDQEPSVLVVTPTELSFGEVDLGDEETLSFAIGNAAAAGAMSLELSALDSGGDSEFTISGGDCMVGSVLEPGEDCLVEVSFSPSELGGFNGQVNVNTADGQFAAVTLSAEGVQDPAEMVLSENALDFDEVYVQQMSSLAVVVSNAADVGAKTLELSTLEVTGSEEFNLIGGDCMVGTELEPGESCVLEVQFAPMNSGPHSGTLEIGSADGQSQTVSLAGEGRELPDELFDDRFEVVD